jgi:hypothetical protein
MIAFSLNGLFMLFTPFRIYQFLSIYSLTLYLKRTTYFELVKPSPKKYFMHGNVLRSISLPDLPDRT